MVWSTLTQQLPGTLSTSRCTAHFTLQSPAYSPSLVLRYCYLYRAHISWSPFDHKLLRIIHRLFSKFPESLRPQITPYPKVAVPRRLAWSKLIINHHRPLQTTPLPLALTIPRVTPPSDPTYSHMTPKPKAKPSSTPKTKAKIKAPRTLQATMKKTPTPKGKAIRHHTCRLNPPCKQGHGGPAKAILPIGKYFFSEEALEHDLGALKKGAVYKGDKEFYKRVKAWYKAEVDRCMHRKLVESEVSAD